MRSYGQYCAVAKSLDVLGDRWTLLIARELLLAEDLGAAQGLRYTDLRAALPGIATNLLAERLRDALGRWGVRYMAEGPAEGDVFRGEWLAWPAEQFLADSRPQDPPVRLAVTVDGETLMIETGGGTVRSRAAAPGERPDAAIEGGPQTILGLLSGNADLESARAKGLRVEGDPAVIGRLQPAAGAASAPATR